MKRLRVDSINGNTISCTWVRDPEPIKDAGDAKIFALSCLKIFALVIAIVAPLCALATLIDGFGGDFAAIGQVVVFIIALPAFGFMLFWANKISDRADDELTRRHRA